MSRVTANGSDAAFIKSWDGWDEMDTMSIILYGVELNRDFYTAEQLAELDKYQVLDVCIMHDKSILEFYGFTAEALQEQEDRRTLGDNDFCAQGNTFVVPFKIVRA